MTLATYDVGDTVRMRAVFTSTAGGFIDPSVVTFIFRDPLGMESTYTTLASTLIDHPSSGVYTLDHLIDTAGTWRWRSYSTGTLHTAAEDAFVVRRQWVPAST